MQQTAKYLPALGLHFLTPLYDPLVKWFMPERKIKLSLVQQAQITTKDHLLDVGCGTGTLAILIKQAQPAAEVVGLDPDPDILAIARKKANTAGHQIVFNQGFASSLPYPDH